MFPSPFLRAGRAEVVHNHLSFPRCPLDLMLTAVFPRLQNGYDNSAPGDEGVERWDTKTSYQVRFDVLAAS